ncbi:MAG: hypothetical protein ACP5N2_00210 [Candidatus Nanoarchaeia archaeon]
MQNNSTRDNLDAFDNFLLKYSSAIDDIDMFLGPISTLAAWHDNDFIQKLGLAAITLDVGIIKTPFIVLYTLKTGDYKTPIAWLGWEALAHAIPYEGGILSIRRNYEKNTREYYKLKEQKEETS